MINMFDDCIVMAGGSGTRLWPLSNSKKPKQFLPVSKGGKESFFSKSLERAFKAVNETNGRVIVIAGKSHIPFIIKECTGLDPADKKRLVLIPEPIGKNTAVAIACALEYVQKTAFQNRSILVLTSDHIIKPIETFLRDVKKAASLVSENKLILFGILPSKPMTEYGYIETEEKLSKNIYTVTTFKEKPDQKTAEKYIAGKRYFWNSGIFAFCSDFIKAEFKRITPDLCRSFEQLKPPDKKSYKTIKGLKILETWEGLDHVYQKAKNLSFDITIAEKCSGILMVKAAFNWIDIGNWDEYAKLLSDKFIERAVLFTAETKNCFVCSDIPVAIAGAEDLIVIIQSGKDGVPKAALITKKGKTQTVRDVVEQIKQSGRVDIL